MTALFKVSRQDPTRYRTSDGQCFAVERDARAYEAEMAMIRILSKGRRGGLQTLNLVRAITSEMPEPDVVALRDMLRAYLERIKPGFLAIPDPVGWVREDGRDVRHAITLPWGDTADDRAQAALETFKALIQWMAADHIRPYGTIGATVGDVVAQHGLPDARLSPIAVRALCGVSRYASGEGARKLLNPYELLKHFKEHLEERNDRGRTLPGQEERMLAALDAALVKLATPVARS